MLRINETKQYGDGSSKNVFIQLVDEHDLELMDSEAEAVRSLSASSDWCIKVIPVSDWNQDLTPWGADPVFGTRRFGDGAPETLEELLKTVTPGCAYCLCGYSLAGLFALWAGCQTEAFSGIVAASPSVWYPDWVTYAENNRMKAPSVYLSLGDREEKAKNPLMATVGNAILRQQKILGSAGIRVTLEWNPGNHFRESDKRMAKGIAWMLKNMTDKI